MSTKKPTPNNKANPQKPAGSSSGKEKKRKSAGFIETSGFKPNWLETGPLSPDMLPDSPQSEENLLTVDEFEALQASLQRFYSQNAPEAPDEPTAEGSAPAAEEEPVAPVAEEPTAEATVPEPQPEAHVAEAAETSLVAELSPPPLDEVDAWVEPLLTAAPEPAPTMTAFPPPTPPTELAADEFVIEPIAADLSVDEAPAVEPEAEIFAPDTTPAGETIADVDEAEIFAPDTKPAGEPAADVDEDEILTLDIQATGPSVEDIPMVETATAPRRVKTPRPRRRPDRLSLFLLLVSLLLFALAAVIYYVNPFSRLALGAASLARPVSSPAVAAPRTGSGDWCLQANFLAESAAVPRLLDSGEDGDILARDRVFSLDYTIPAAGVYEWRVVDCADPNLAFPEGAAWVSTTTDNEPVTFIFDSNERADRLFFPIPFAVSAADDTNDFRVIGSFQDWSPDDASGQLERINVGLYQQIRKIARAGSYEAYVIAGDSDLAIDAYGRTTTPIPFSFQTDRNGDYVIFLVDTDRGRASVLYDMPPVLTSLAFGNGYRLMSLVLAGLAAMLLLGMVIRLLIMRNSRLRLEAGCPRCGQQELMRIARRPTDRLLHLFGIPAYRYRCRHCTWEGTRLSDSGMAVSPGVTVTPVDGR